MQFSPPSWVLKLLLLCLLILRPREHIEAAKSAKGAGTLPGEDHYIREVLPQDLAFAAAHGDVAGIRRVQSFGSVPKYCV
eukprot:SAG31_NODE_232_length_19710_cov_17.109581_11_plen_80_part_00